MKKHGGCSARPEIIRRGACYVLQCFCSEDMLPIRQRLIDSCCVSFFPLGLFLSAFLLFIIQPMVAKTLLPVYGGTPAVWTVCMLFFQTGPVLAYGYVFCFDSLGCRYLLFVPLLPFLQFAFSHTDRKSSHPRPVVVNTAQLPWSTVLAWIFLSFIPCSLMLGVTFYISTDVAATPLLWIAPLALYLVAFILCFAQKQVISYPWVQRNALFF